MFSKTLNFIYKKYAIIKKKEKKKEEYEKVHRSISRH